MAVRTRRLAILGATGTIGRRTLDLLAEADSPLVVVALSAHSRAEELHGLAAVLPGCASYLTGVPSQAEDLLSFLAAGEGYDLCLNGVVGAAGLPYSEAVLRAGRDLALANKESLVLAGELLTTIATTTGAALLPVDSEHSAIQQCLHGRTAAEVRHLYLTASGGALRDRPVEELSTVTPEEALAHPNWSMGPRITVDSATMMNKAFEILEAQCLFGIPARDIRVLIHRQSVVHSMVEFVDGSMLAQLGPPDMAFPIHYALHGPFRERSPLRGFDAKLFSNLSFEEPDPSRYPALSLGFRAADLGGAAGAVLNAADEVAVEAFLSGRLSYSDIVPLCAAALDALGNLPAHDLPAVYSADQRARAYAREQCSVLR